MGTRGWLKNFKEILSKLNDDGNILLKNILDL